MKNIIFLALALIILGAGCQPTNEPVRQSIYEPNDSSPFYINSDYTETTFELSLPNRWAFEEDNTAKIVKFYDTETNENITLQVYVDENPVSLIEAHMNLISKDNVLLNTIEMVKLVGTGMDPEATTATHVIYETDYGWFVFSGYEYNANMIEIIPSLTFYEN